MTLSREITKLDHSSIKLTLNVGKDDVSSEYETMLADYTKKIQIPGFRKGKVPKEVFVRKFGDTLKIEALGRIAEKSIEEVFGDESFPKDSKPLPYSTPRLFDEENLKLDLGQDLNFSVVYDVMPQFAVEKWQGFEVEVPEVIIEEEDINREIELIRDRNSIVMDKNDGEESCKGDVVTIDFFEISENGAPVQSTERKDFVFTLGSGYNMYGFDDDIAGMKKGEVKEFSKTYPEDFDDNDLKGKTKKLSVKLTALKIKKLPDLDDDLAQDVNEKFKTFSDLKNDIKEKLEKDLERRIKDKKVSAILEKIMEAVPVEIPESMTRIELDSRWRNFARRFNTDSEGLHKMMESNPGGAQGILDGWKPDAEKALHSRLIVEKLIENLGIEVSDEEAKNEIENQAKESDASVEEVEKYYEQENMMIYLKEEIKERKFFDRLIAENTVKNGEKEKFMDFIRNNG